MPLLVYPLLALVFQRFLLTSLTGDQEVEYVIGFESEDDFSLFARQLGSGTQLMDDREEEAESKRRAGEEPGSDSFAERRADDFTPGSDPEHPTFQWLLLPAGTAKRHVEDASVHLAVFLQSREGNGAKNGLSIPTSWHLAFRAGSPTSEAALQFVESRLHAYNVSHLDLQLKRLGVMAASPATTHRHAVTFAGAPAFSLAALIPLILILTTVTGAVYPAIDLTAGERERGTLETLIAAPVPRAGLLLAKYVAVLTVALLTAIVNLVAMTITAHSTGLSESLFGGGMSGLVILKVLLLLALFAAFFSAILLAVTSYARSFKEAQAYIIPLMLLCLVPGIICLTPSLVFTGWLAVTPLVNIVILARDVLEGSVDPTLATAAVFSTVLYVVAAIALAARIFGTDAVLYGSQATWTDLVRRPNEEQPALGLPAAAFCLAVMFPCYFVLSASLARSPDVSMDYRLMIGGLITAFVFGAIPWSIATWSRVKLGRDAGPSRSSAVGLLAAVLLGFAVWPFAHEIFLLNEWFGLPALPSEQIESVKSLLAEWRGVSPALILITLALIPGIFEEFSFRGIFFTSLRRILSPGRTIVVSALLFGSFHVVAATTLAPERFLPSTFLGLVLGWVRWRTGRVVPCIVLHTIHNALLLSVVYWSDELAARGFGVQETLHLPASWLAAAAVGIAVAVTMLLMATKPTPSALQAPQPAS
jgi:ABC-2 type transport system permease protein/sodium transport system permease protein